MKKFIKKPKMSDMIYYKSMKNLWKKFLMALLGFSNLAVLATVFHIYFDSHQSVFLFSVSEDEADLREKVKTECKDYLQELVDGDRTSFSCFIKLSQKHRGASYYLRTRVEVTKNDSGGFEIKGKGQIRDPTRHATEADFCNDCSKTEQVAESDFEEAMKQIVDMAETIYSEAQTSVQKAHEEYTKKDRERRMAALKERHCKGSWNEEDEEYKEFDLEEKLNCKMNKISSLGLPLEVEEYYHKELKNELWKIALSEDDYILADNVLDKFNDPLRYSFSVRASTGLIDRYLGWKDDYEVLNAQERTHFLRNVGREVNQTIQVMTQEQSQKDLYYLNQGFDGLLLRLDQATSGSAPRLTKPPAAGTSPTITPVNYEGVRKGVQGLY